MILQAEYARRRARLMRSIGANEAVLISAASLRSHSRDVNVPFRQDSDFLYLTGFQEPGAVALLVPNAKQGDYVIFCAPRDPVVERWEGYCPGLEGACDEYGADVAYPIKALSRMLPELLGGRDSVWYTLGKNPALDAFLSRIDPVANRKGKSFPHTIRNLDKKVHEMRLFKSRSELALMRRSVQICAQSHRRAMARAYPGCYEFEIQAELGYERQKHNMGFAYEDIVASGANACVLHYTRNTRRMEEGDLVLVDSGGMYQGYASDLTRTWPVGGEFTPAQREIYELVLEARDAAIKCCVIGNDCREPHRVATRILTRGLVSLGLLKGRWQTLWKNREYLPFYMHNTAHWLGMDVHDVGDYFHGDTPRPFRSGMVTTIEPGLYFAPELKGVRKRFRGIGVRIEDDVAIRKSGPEILSGDLPVDPDEVCRMVGVECVDGP